MFGFDDILGAVAGPLIGGLLGGSSASSGGGASQTATKEPWAEAAPWLKNQIAQGQQLQNYYQQNPFNAQQQTAYQNTFNDLDNFRSNTAPGLMSFANSAMTGSYQRQPVSRPGMGAGYGVPDYFAANPDVARAFAADNYGLDKDSFARTHYAKFGQAEGRAPVSALPSGAAANPTPGGLLGGGQGPFGMTPQPASQPMPMGGFMGGLLGVMDGSMFQPKQTSSQYGQVDFGAMNPFTNGGVTAKATPDPKTVEQMVSEELARQNASRPMGDPWQGGSA